MLENINTSDDEKPLIPAHETRPEITVKSVVLAIILALVLGASNVYLALKIGTTISASIPASILALGILRFFKNSNVLESNIAQTAASAGEGIAAAAAFILPALIILHIWQGFPYWETTLVVMLGGLLGVFFSIPLRRVLLNLPTLRFPEGTAIGKVLRTAAEETGQIKYLVQGGAAGAIYSLLQTGLKVASDQVALWFTTAKSIFGMTFGFTSAALAAGYIIGFEVGLSLLVGLIVGWMIILPLLAWHFGLPAQQSTYDMAMQLWSNYLRYIGVGTMLVGGVWTLLRLLQPLAKGLKDSFTHMKTMKGTSGYQIPRTEKDIPIGKVVIGTILTSILIYFFTLHFMIADLQIQAPMSYLNFACLISLIYVLIVGFLLATVCGYFTGLVGSTNNPLSGIMIISVLILAGIYLFLFKHHIGLPDYKIVSLVVLVATVVACTASIANENLQDLKAGMMVGATPWKQQIMLALGVVVSAFITGPILDLLFKAYGMAGVFPHPGMSHAQMLAAPQASMLAAVASGVITGNLQWNMIGIGAGLAVIFIIMDEFLKQYQLRLPALAVGISIYLPPEVMTPIIIGTLISYFVKRKTKKAKNEAEIKQYNKAYQYSILVACGMVAGSAVIGVILAIPFAIAGSSDALSIMPDSLQNVATIISAVIFIGFCVWFYRIATKK